MNEPPAPETLADLSCGSCTVDAGAHSLLSLVLGLTSFASSIVSAFDRAAVEKKKLNEFQSFFFCFFGMKRGFMFSVRSMEDWRWQCVRCLVLSGVRSLRSGVFASEKGVSFRAERAKGGKHNRRCCDDDDDVPHSAVHNNSAELPHSCGCHLICLLMHIKSLLNFRECCKRSFYEVVT